MAFQGKEVGFTQFYENHLGEYYLCRAKIKPQYPGVQWMKIRLPWLYTIHD